MKTDYSFVTNKKFGYIEIEPKPGEDYLREYYEEKYYQDEKATYSHSYSDDEKKYFQTKIGQKLHVLNELFGSEANQSRLLLDIGCGEGFTLDYFRNAGWGIEGIDFSDFGIKSVHPHLCSFFKKGNIWDSIENLLTEKKQYDVVWLDNVLEHVVDPAMLLSKANKLTKPGGILIIEVPNDFSKFQLKLIETGKVERKYWEAYPDHLIYFSRESLISLCQNTGWVTEKVIADFPIEWFLINDHSNYARDKTLGKQAHKARIFLENFLDNEITAKNDLINFYESMSKIGQGRQIIGFFRKA